MAFTKIVGAGIQTTTDVTVGNVQAGIITATTFSGSFTGAVTGTATSTTNIPNLTGAITSSNTTTSLGSFSSSDLATALTDETGSGAAVFATSPTLSTVTVSSGGINVTGVSTFSGGIQGNVTGNVNSSGVSTFSSVNVTGNVSIGGTLTYDDVTNVDSIGLVTARSGVRIDAGGLVVTAGVSTFTTGPVIIGAATSTGTASQPLQVTGGAYVSGNLGVGITNPQAPLHVVGSGTTALLVSGNARITGILTVGTSSLTFDGNANTITGLSTITGSSNFSKPNLSSISSTTADTATDVFVYDTRKDSDGGAWRKRTQHTSWYNETLNTATRGARREFPAVAVIVAETSKVTIYDGDDPDIPMWMVFNAGSAGMSSTPMLQQTGYSKVVCMLNGILVTGTGNGGSNYGQPIINFISEKVLRMDSESNEGGIWLGNIADRDSSKGYASSNEDYVIASSQVNDVAMTVLPNAPIDAATGLPVPTIAVATNGGVSVIKDDGSVVNITCNNGSYTTSRKVTFLDDNALGLSLENSNAASEDSFYIFNIIPAVSTIISVDTKTGSPISANALYSVQYAPQVGAVGVDLHILGSDSLNRTITRANRLNFANTYGLSTIAENRSSPNNGMVAYATTSYNTGWMHGDIKGAFLSDTDATNVTGTELITNGDFSNGLTGWSVTQTGSASVTVNGSNQVVVTSADSSTNLGEIRQNVTITRGVDYIYSFTMVSGALYNGGLVSNNRGPGSYQFVINEPGTGDATYSIYLVPPGYFGTFTADNFSLRRAERDRSVNGAIPTPPGGSPSNSIKGLQVFGTITKSAVATAAELVAYSGFSASNYLLQPYNSVP
jgi:hypothetical protein